MNVPCAWSLAYNLLNQDTDEIGYLVKVVELCAGRLPDSKEGLQTSCVKPRPLQ